MKGIKIILACSLIMTSLFASNPEKKFIHFFSSNVSSQNDHLTKKNINGASDVFSNAIVYNDINSKLNSFNDTANINFNVFCGRIYIDYSKIDDWEYALSDQAVIQEAFKKIKTEEGFTGNIDKTLYLDALRAEYNKYLNNTNGKPSVLFIYIEAYEYDIAKSTATQAKWTKKRIFGFVDKNLPQQEKLKINYVKSLWGQIKPTIQLNAENKPDPQYIIQSYINKYIQEHGKPIIQPNPNCNSCPINPKSNANYWDDKGRLWRYTKTNCNDTNWVDLSYEFSNSPCGNDVWKQGVDVQYVHKQYYDDKINFLKNYPLQQLAGGVTPELEKNLWQATQFATVYALKSDYVNAQVGWQGWIPFWGSALTGYYQANISNGDLIFQTQAGFSFIMAATDISLVKSIAQNVVKIGFKKWIIDGGIKIATKNAWYRAGKGCASFKLGYQLRNAPIQGVTLYEKQLAQGIEIVEEASSKYIKYDKLNGDVLIGKFSDNVEKDILFEKSGKLTNAPQNLTDEQLSEWLINNADNALNNADNWMDDVFNLQKSVVNQNKNIIANASNNAKGAWGEMASDAFLTEKGFQPLHPRKSALTDGWGETGIDGIFKKNGQYYIVEAKYTGSATLNTAADGKQLSKGWIEGSNRLENAVGFNTALDIKQVGYKKIWAKVAPDGTIVFKEATDDLATTFIDFIP